MTDQTKIQKPKTTPSVELITALTQNDINDLCDATDEAIQAGGGFGWLHLPSQDILERYWQGVITVPTRLLFVARLDGVICGTAQLILPAPNNEAQAHAVQLTTTFMSPWARGQGLSRMLLDKVESTALERGYKIINLDVRDTQKAAIALYESHGYQLCGTHPHYAEVDGKKIGGRYYYKEL
jgi:ribosomal protein S18 acetylase RimI-like enzyme